MSRREYVPPEPPFDPDEFYDGPSKSRRKRDAADLVRLGEELVELAPSELDALPLPESLRDAIDLARTITAHGGRARQRQYIGKLLRKIDVGPIRVAISDRQLAQKHAARAFHRIEAWRDRLVAEGDPAIEALVAIAPQLDAARLRGAVEMARDELATGRAPAAARELFRYLRDTLASAELPGR